MTKQATGGTAMRDKAVEQALMRLGVEFEYRESIPWQRFNLRASRENQARLGDVLNQQEVERYEQSMRAGYELPAVVCHEAPGGFVLNDGNHRQAAAERVGREETDAYVLQTQDVRLLSLVTRCLNALIGGYTPNATQRLRGAVEYLAIYPETPLASLATLFGVSQRAIGEYDREQRVLRTLGGAKVRHIDRLSRPVLQELHTLADHEPVMVEAAKVIATYGLRGERAGGFLRDVKAKKSDDARKKAVRDAEAKLRDEGNRPVAPAPAVTTHKPPVLPLTKPRRDELFRLTDRLLRLLREHPSMNGLQLTHPDDERRFRESFKSLAAAYKAIVDPGADVVEAVG
jgi:hypothetical protein